MKRRGFITQIAGTGAIASATPLSAKRILGANECIHVELIGCGGRGRYDSRLMRQVPNVNFTVVFDVYESHAARAGLACQAGKDVYVEKPRSYCIDERGGILERARHYRGVVQFGTQHCSAPRATPCLMVRPCRYPQPTP